jgi:hypothetical protein
MSCAYGFRASTASKAAFSLQVDTPEGPNAVKVGFDTCRDAADTMASILAERIANPYRE